MNTFPSKSFSHFIFDFDGTLADSRLNIANSFNFALKERNLATIEDALIHPLIGKKNLEQMFILFYPELSENLVADLIALFREYQSSHAVEEIMLFPDVKETLTSLKLAGAELAILTTKNTKQISNIADQLGIYSLFNIIYGTGLPYGEKPEGRCVDYLLTQFSSEPQKQRVVMIGDSSVDAETAKNGGIDFLGVPYGTDDPQQLLEIGAIGILDPFSKLVEWSVHD